MELRNADFGLRNEEITPSEPRAQATGPDSRSSQQEEEHKHRSHATFRPLHESRFTRAAATRGGTDSNLKSHISHFKSRISNLKSQISNLKSRISNLKSQILDLRSQILDFRYRISGCGFRISQYKPGAFSPDSFSGDPQGSAALIERNLACLTGRFTVPADRKESCVRFYKIGFDVPETDAAIELE